MRTHRSLQSAIVALLALLLAGCTPEQLTRFTQALNQSAASESLAPILRRAVNWTVENFSHTALGAGIPIRDSDSGPILGRWFIKRLRFQETQDGNLVAEIAGEGYRHGRYTGVVTFVSAAKVLYRADMKGQDADNFLITFTPLKIFDVTASVVRGGLLAQLGDAFDVPRQKMEERTRRGFTVSLNTRMERHTYLGLGQPKDLPPKPWIDLGLDEVLLNDRIGLCEHARHFLGPFKVGEGKTLQWAVKPSSNPAGRLNAHLLADEDARSLRDTYIDSRRSVKDSYPTYKSQSNTAEWQNSLTFKVDAVTWLVIEPSGSQSDMVVDVCVGIGP